MEKTFTAFISLGLGCGPEMGDYGEFTVDLTQDEVKQVNEVVNIETKGYKRKELEKRYPELHAKIERAASSLARDVIVHNAFQFIDLGDFIECDDDDEEKYEAAVNAEIAKIDAMEYHDAADYMATKYDLEPDDIEGAAICYYLTKEELPSDYEPRTKGRN